MKKRVFFLNAKRLILMFYAVMFFVFTALFVHSEGSEELSASSMDASELIEIASGDIKRSNQASYLSLEDLWSERNPSEIIRPGESVDLDYKLSNISDFDMEVKETFILSSSVPLSQAVPEYRLFLDAVADEYGAMVGGRVVGSETVSEYQVRYEIEPFLLSKSSSKVLNYKMVFDKAADHVFQQSICTVDYLVAFRESSVNLSSEEGWKELMNATLSFAGVTNLDGNIDE